MQKVLTRRGHLRWHRLPPLVIYPSIGPPFLQAPDALGPCSEPFQCAMHGLGCLVVGVFVEDLLHDALNTLETGSDANFLRVEKT